MNILVSACLLGLNTRYDGCNNINSEVCSIMNDFNIIPICPEQLGGMSTPRLPSEIHGGNARDVLEGRARVINSEGDEVTDKFIRGADETLNIAKIYNSKMAILKSKSPSCGYGNVYDGSFSKVLKEGNGISTELLIQNGIIVFSEKDILKFLAELELHIKNK